MAINIHNIQTWAQSMTDFFFGSVDKSEKQKERKKEENTL